MENGAVMYTDSIVLFAFLNSFNDCKRNKYIQLLFPEN